VTFGRQLAEVITGGGWRAQHKNMAFFGAPSGLHLRCPAAVDQPLEVTAQSKRLCTGGAILSRALTEAGQKVTLMLWPAQSYEDFERAGIELVIGYKR
jgi:hypothetical protein